MKQSFQIVRHIALPSTKSLLYHYFYVYFHLPICKHNIKSSASRIHIHYFIKVRYNKKQIEIIMAKFIIISPCSHVYWSLKSQKIAICNINPSKLKNFLLYFVYLQIKYKTLNKLNSSFFFFYYKKFILILFLYMVSFIYLQI